MSFLQNMLGVAAPSSFGPQGLANNNTAQQQHSLMQAYQAAQAAKIQAQTAMNPNVIEAYRVPLSTLVNMWQAKFGDEWVDRTTIEDAFYRHAYARLLRTEKFEVFEDWVRLLEGV